MDDLKEIKKLYGEKMSHLCRTLFPTILEHPGELFNLLRSNFNEDRELYNDLIKRTSSINNFRKLIFASRITINNVKIDKTSKEYKTPKQLLLKAGYDLYKCKTGEDIAKFKKYYADGEDLCTFIDGENGEDRLKRSHVWWAVRKDADKIKRAPKPCREDDYGTSVMSIQISKQGNWLSIINRYNHSVENPNATHGNNLDNIIPGLTDAFNREYNLSVNTSQHDEKFDFCLNNYIRADDGRIYRYNFEKNNIFYCPNNIIIDNGKVKKFDKSKYVLMDTFILSKKKLPQIFCYDKNSDSTFIQEDISDRKVKEQNKRDENGEEYTEITLVSSNKKKNDIIIKIDKNNEIIGYENRDVQYLGNKFLTDNRKLKELILPKVQKIDEPYFMFRNETLKKIDMEQLTEIGAFFMLHNPSLTEINLPKLKKIDDFFMSCNDSVTDMHMPNLTSVGDDFLSENKKLTKLNLPKLKTAGDNFLYENDSLKELTLEQLKEVGDGFLWANESLTKVDLPELTTAGDDFMDCNTLELQKSNIPKLRRIGNGCNPKVRYIIDSLS